MNDFDDVYQKTKAYSNNYDIDENVLLDYDVGKTDAKDMVERLRVAFETARQDGDEFFEIAKTYYHVIKEASHLVYDAQDQLERSTDAIMKHIKTDEFARDDLDALLQPLTDALGFIEKKLELED